MFRLTICSPNRDNRKNGSGSQNGNGFQKKYKISHKNNYQKPKLVNIAEVIKSDNSQQTFFSTLDLR